MGFYWSAMEEIRQITKELKANNTLKEMLGIKEEKPPIQTPRRGKQ